jgi:hypothetical protein
MPKTTLSVGSDVGNAVQVGELEPAFAPRHVQLHGPLPDTAVPDPEEHRALPLGADINC